jgi:hypothetical protein
VQEGDLNRRMKRSVSFVTGASAVIVALALMAVADGGGKLPVIGRVPVLGIPGPASRAAAPAVPREPVETPGASPLLLPVSSESATPAPLVAAEPVAPAPPTELIRIDNPAPVTTPLVTPPPVGKKPRPEPVPVTSPSAPPSETPPKRQFGGPGIAGARGSGRGLGGGGSAGTTSGGKGTGKHAPPDKAKGKGKGDGKGKGKGKGEPPRANGSHGSNGADHPQAAQHAASYPPAPVRRAQIAAVAPPERGRTAVRSSRSGAPRRHRGTRPSSQPRSR